MTYEKYRCWILNNYPTMGTGPVVDLLAGSVDGGTAVLFAYMLDFSSNQALIIRVCLLVRQSFFHNDPLNFVELGGGVQGFKGFHSSFRTTLGELSLNIDVSTTLLQLQYVQGLDLTF